MYRIPRSRLNATLLCAGLLSATAAKADTIQVTDNLTGNVTWYSTNEYVLNGFIYVLTNSVADHRARHGHPRQSRHRPQLRRPLHHPRRQNLRQRHPRQADHLHARKRTILTDPNDIPLWHAQSVGRRGDLRHERLEHLQRRRRQRRLAQIRRLRRVCPTPRSTASSSIASAAMTTTTTPASSATSPSVTPRHDDPARQGNQRPVAGRGGPRHQDRERGSLRRRRRFGRVLRRHGQHQVHGQHLQR